MPEFERRIIHLPGTKLTPEVVLHRTLTKLDHIQSVAVIIQWNDGTFDIDWSNQKVSELCMGSMIFQKEVQDQIG